MIRLRLKFPQKNSIMKGEKLICCEKYKFTVFYLWWIYLSQTAKLVMGLLFSSPSFHILKICIGILHELSFNINFYETRYRMLINKPLGRFETVGTSFMNDYINMTTSSIFQLSSGGLSRTYKPLDTLFLLSSGGLGALTSHWTRYFTVFLHISSLVKTCLI